MYVVIFKEVMKKIFFVIFVVVLVFAIACNQKEVNSPIEEVETSNIHIIPIDEALETLNSFWAADETVKSGEIPSRVPASVSTVNASRISVATKGLSRLDPMDYEELLYIINFKDGKGYAILAADDRISEKLLMVADSGSMTSEDYYEQLADGYNPVSTKSSGEGPIIYNQNGEPCINQDAITLYDDEVGDSYVVDYYGQGHNTGNGGAPTNFIHDFIENDLGGGHNGGFPIDDPEETIIQTNLGTTVTTPVSPLLVGSDLWSQSGSPFQDYFPVLSNGNHAYVGCVPLAIARIIAYHEFPSTISYNGTQVNWYALKNNITSTTGQESAAALMRKVAAECGSLFFSEGTFTFPLFAKWYLQRCSYSNVSYSGYNTQTVVAALNNGCPLFICSVPYLGGVSFDFGKSHGWNIDGYKLYVTTTQLDHYINGVLSYTTYSNVTKTMVHCDFGWGRSCNGYYTSGIFNLSPSSNTLFDNPADLGDTINYNCYIKTITYSHP